MMNAKTRRPKPRPREATPPLRLVIELQTLANYMRQRPSVRPDAFDLIASNPEQEIR